MNVVLVGYGSIAREHVRAITQLRDLPDTADLRLYGVVGRDLGATEAFAREFGVAVATTELDRILEDPSVHAVVITSPTALHAGQTERALRAGKHVLCEIPLATSLEETDRLIQVAQQSGRRLMVCHTQRYDAGLMEVRKRVTEGGLHVHSVSSRQVRLRRENVNWMGRRRSWTDNLLWHHACHSVDTMLWLLGATEVEVSAQLALPGGNLDTPMDLTVVLRTPRDQIGTAVLSYNSHFELHDYLVIGEETSLFWEAHQLRTPYRVLIPGASDSQADAITRQDAEFFSAVREGREPALSPGAVRPTMVVLQAAQDTLDARIRALGPSDRHPELP